MEREILIWIQENLRNDLLTPVIMTITNLGHYGLIWILAALVLLFRKGTSELGSLSLASIALCGGVSEIIKHFVMRPRPFLAIQDLMVLGQPPHSFSFPSGHTVCAFAFAFIVWKMCRGRVRYFTLFLAAVMAFSRVYVGAHYPTDLLGGLLIAWLGSLLIWRYRSSILNLIP